MNHDIYISGPFKDPNNLKLVTEINNLCESNGFKTFHTLKDGIVLDEDSDNDKIREAIRLGIDATLHAKIFIAIGLDPGVMFELGLAWRYGKRIIYFSKNKPNKVISAISNYVIEKDFGELNVALQILGVDYDRN